MNQWHLKRLGDGIQAHAPSNEIQQAFRNLARVRNSDMRGIAVFSYYDLCTNVVTVYFTPESHDLAAMFAAEPCEKPAPNDRLSLLVGAPNAKEFAGL